MSTVPIAGVGFPPLSGVGAARGRRIGIRSGPFLHRVGADLRSVPRYVIRYTVLVLALCGLLTVWESYGDGRIPGLCPLRTIDPHRVSSLHCGAKGVDSDARWQGLSAALAILDQVNPEVASWVRQEYEAGALVFSDEYCRGPDKQGSLAKYDHFQRRLIVQRALFEENDGEVAAILCHEYRHSRQNPAKLVKCALSFVVSADGDRSILENDALLYEHEARVAIFAR
jgi:hypothetical protein